MYVNYLHTLYLYKKNTQKQIKILKIKNELFKVHIICLLHYIPSMTCFLGEE